jgi:hypothetical protein
MGYSRVARNVKMLVVTPTHLRRIIPTSLRKSLMQCGNRREACVGHVKTLSLKIR